MTRETLVVEFGGFKPCLHGSDAHRPETVAAPAQDRRCWLKGSVTFETLRQTRLEPEMRVFVGTAAPPAAQPSQVMTEVEVKGAPFFVDARVPLNPGLIGIIGARGSGKTALADLIAAGGAALSLKANKLSFVYRARDHLSGAQVDLSWDDGSGCGTDEYGEGSGLQKLTLVLVLLAMVGLFVPLLAVEARRFHDQDRSGWPVLLNLIPYFGVVIVLIMMLLEGTKGDNRFGPDPKAT